MDISQTPGLLTGELRNLLNIIGAAGGLGAAAYGLVDGSKVFWGGVSNVGFGHVVRALEPFDDALERATYGDWRASMRAHWLNGAPLSDQKATAKSLIHLGLTPENAMEMAQVTTLDPLALGAAAAKLDRGAPLAPTDVNALGRFDAAVDARLDAGYERADQQYRNVARAFAGAVALILAAVAGGILWMGGEAKGSGFHLFAYLDSRDFLLSLLVGAIAVPIAPVAKDLASTLQAAAQAAQSVKV